MDNASSTSAFDVDQELSNEDALGNFNGRTDTSTGGMQSEQQQQQSSLKEQAASKAGEVKEQVKQQAGELLNRTRDEMKAQLSSQKDRAAESLSGFASTLHQTADQCLNDDMAAGLGGYAHRAAEQVDRFTDYLRTRDVDDVIREAEDMARRQPTLFIAGSFLIGMAIARFLKSGSPNRHALVPVSTYDMTPNSLRGSRDAMPTGERAPSAHNYVPGIGVTSEPRDNTGSGSSTFGGSSFSSGTESSSSSTFGSSSGTDSGLSGNTDTGSSSGI